MTRARTFLFWALAAALLVGHGILAWHSLTVWRFWEDEAYNLTVPRNLLDGLGYTSDGALSGSILTPFDPRISTGPVVLLPVAAVLAIGADPVIAARIIPLVFWALLLIGLAVLGRRLGGRWAALLAVAVPLAFASGAGVSPIQGPADLLGEIPAAALIVWALVVLPRRAWLAGLLVGLAVQAKLIALLVLPAFAVALWILSDGTGRARVRDLLRRAWLPIVLVGVPTLLVELSALLSLGPAGFVDHLRALYGFLRSGGQGGAPTTVMEKIGTLAGSWSVPAVVAILSAMLVIALVTTGAVTVLRPKHRPLSEDDRRRLAIIAAAGVGALAFVGWWANASHLPLWVRHPAPGIFAFFPVLAAAAVWGAQRVQRPRPVRVASVGAAVLVAVFVGASGMAHTVDALQPRWETLAMQRAAATALSDWVQENDVDWLAAEPWGAAVAPIVLTGAHVGLFDAPSMSDAPRLTGLPCTTEALADAGYYRICAAP